MLIRHNVRDSARNGGGTWAHDSEQIDVNGVYVSGSQERFITSETRRCPATDTNGNVCNGYGKLVKLRDGLARADHPIGSVMQPEHLARPLYRETVVRENVETIIPDEIDVPPTPVAPVTSDVPADMAPVWDALKIGQGIDAAVSGAVGNLRDEMAAEMQKMVDGISVPTTWEIVRHDVPTVTISGAHYAFAECLNWLSALDAKGRPRNLYLVGPAGCGKTSLAEDLAAALGREFRFTGQVLSEHQVMGFVDAAGNYHTTPFRDAFENGGLWLGDEFDSWSPEAALAMNAALANGVATFPDSPIPVKRHADTLLIVAANTYGNGADRQYVGRNVMDKASLSRFVAVPLDYDSAIETAIAGSHTDALSVVRKVRENAARLQSTIIAGTRELEHIVAWLNSGHDMATAVNRVLRQDLSDAEWQKVSA
jgi:cobaltochelatase CobS